MKIKLTTCCLLALLFASSVVAVDTTYIQSPDKKVVFRLFQQNKQLAYSVGLLNQTVIEPSVLRMTIDGKPVSEGAVAGKPL